MTVSIGRGSDIAFVYILATLVAQQKGTENTHTQLMQRIVTAIQHNAPPSLPDTANKSAIVNEAVLTVETVFRLADAVIPDR